MFLTLMVTDDDFRELYFKYYKYAGTVCLNTIKRCYPEYFSYEELKDILQETFMKLYMYMNKVDEIKNMKSLIARIATLTTIKYMDNYVKNFKKELADAEEHIEESIDIVFDDDDFSRLIEVIKTLHPRYSSVLLLKNLHGMSLKYISELSDIPYNTILSWHRRGKRLLAKKLKSLDYNTGKNVSKAALRKVE